MLAPQAPQDWNLLWLLPLFPLLGSAICGLLHFATLGARKANPDADGPSGLAPLVACAAIGGSFVFTLIAFFKLLGEGAPTVLESCTWNWIDAGSLSIHVSMVVDRLSSVMCLVVTGVGLLIHIYSVGYMKGDPGYAKFFAFLNLFVFAMLILVLSSSLIGLFVGWEGVGLCSYLLIGFWYSKGWPAEAGQKAFVVNRIGDACFLLGSFLLVDLFGTLDLSELAAAVEASFAERTTQWAVAALLLFGGACGKSAQWPLFTWLPDAMAGPTPVSALIHAATMVTAGVYLIARLNPLFGAVPAVLTIVGTVGALTAVIGATSALFQRDIKKVLAYSTVSQLGYMFVALSCGAWAAAIFHLVTHAFFKGLLFLGAGSVIHGMHEEQDMHRMGGLRRHMPGTYRTFFIGSMALAGIPGMSGFFSKDEILAHVFSHGGFHSVLWIACILGAGLTAFYTFRMVALTFHGEERFDKQAVHPHESPSIMVRPLWVLAFLAIFGGLLNLPHVLPLAGGLSHWLEPVTRAGTAHLLASHGGEAAHLGVATEWFLLALGAAIALGFAHKGFHLYAAGTGNDERLRLKQPDLAAFFEKAWRFDSAYNKLIVQPVKLVALVIATLIDQLGIDGAVEGIARTALGLAQRVRKFTDGNVKTYALWMGAGAAGITLVMVWGG